MYTADEDASAVHGATSFKHATNSIDGSIAATVQSKAQIYPFMYLLSFFWMSIDHGGLSNVES